MKLAGTLTEFPLPELLQFLDLRPVTGCLSLDIFSDYYSELRPQKYCIWLERGHVIGLQKGDCDRDIYALAVREEWISPFVAAKLKQRAPKDIPAGLYLESQSAVNFDQLRSLFFSEVVRRIEVLFSVSNSNFCFQTINNLPMNEMTGFRAPAAQVINHSFQRSKFESILDNRDFTPRKSLTYQPSRIRSR